MPNDNLENEIETEVHAVDDPDITDVKTEIAKLKKVSTIVGGKDLKLELERLRNENFDHLSTMRLTDKYWGNMAKLDVAVENELDDASDSFSKIKKIENHPDVRGETWSASDNIWFGVKLDYEDVAKRLFSVISYKDWQIEFLKAILNKMAGVIESIQGISEKKIEAETMAKQMGFMFDRYDKMTDKQSEMNARMMQQMSDSFTNMTRTLTQTMAEGMKKESQKPVPIPKASKPFSSVSNNLPANGSNIVPIKDMKNITDVDYEIMIEEGKKKVKKQFDSGKTPILVSVLKQKEWQNLKKDDKERFDSAKYHIKKYIKALNLGIEE